MSQLISKLFSPFLLCHLLMAFALLGGYVRWPQARRALRWVMLPFVVLVLTSLPPVAHLVTGSLEWGFSASRKRPPETDAIVVLGGSLLGPSPEQEDSELGEDSVYRCLLAAELYHAGPACAVIVSGGKVNAERPGPTLAEAMRAFLVKLQVPEQDIIIEPKSRNTYENAVESAKLLRDRSLKRVVLVTDATHLRRASACFRRQRVDVTPRGSRFRATDLRWELGLFLPSEGAARDVRRVVHEWLGIAWYGLLGRI